MTQVIAAGWRGAPKLELEKRGKKRDIVAHIEDLVEKKGLVCDPIQVLMEVAIGKRRVQIVGTSGLTPDDYEWQDDLVGGYDKQGNPMQVDASTRAKAASELLNYMHPKRKAVEISGSEDKPISFAIVQDLGPLPGELSAEAPALLPADIPAELPADGTTI